MKYPGTLKETTLDPACRALLRVAIADEPGTDQAIQTLMGRDVAPRFAFIMERAAKVEEWTSDFRRRGLLSPRSSGVS